MISVIYRCRCMPSGMERTVSVPYRALNEDVREWMNAVQGKISADHRAYSAICMATAMEYAKIPMPENAPMIGGKPKLDA